jgi:hypothetical protein
MKHLSRALVLITLCIMESAALAAEATSNRVQLENELAFGSEEVAPLSGWRAGGANVQLTEEHVKDGRYAARVSHSSPAFSGVMKSIEPISPEPITMNTCRVWGSTCSMSSTSRGKSLTAATAVSFSTMGAS